MPTSITACYTFHIRRILGNKCAQCGGTKDLEIDHIANDGYIHRKSRRNRIIYYQEIMAQVKEGSTAYQLLCKSCHKKKHEGGVGCRPRSTYSKRAKPFIFNN